MEIILAIIGVLYVVYMLHKEGALVFSRKLLFHFILIIILPLLVSGTIVYISKIHNFAIGIIIGVIIRIIWLIIIFTWTFLSKRSNPYKHKKGSAQVNILQTKEQQIQDIIAEFKKSGYNSISYKVIETLINHPASPLNTGSLKTINVNYCYKWLCEQASFEIDRLSRKEIESQLGIALNTLPLDESVNDKGKASLKRTILAKDYLLRKQGLKYIDLSATFYKYINESEDYFIEFHRIVDNKPQDTS